MLLGQRATEGACYFETYCLCIQKGVAYTACQYIVVVEGSAQLCAVQLGCGQGEGESYEPTSVERVSGSNDDIETLERRCFRERFVGAGFGPYADLRTGDWA